MGKLMIGKRPLFIAGALYIVAILTVLLSAWIADIHRFDLSLTVAKYIALRPWTAVFFFIAFTPIVGLIHGYLRKINIPTYRKVIYGLIFGCAYCCMIFPYNEEWSYFASDMHDFFAYSLMLAVAVSFVVLFMKGETGRKRRCAFLASCFAIFFIFAYGVVQWQFFWDTVFIWENVFILVMACVLYTDDSLPSEETLNA